MTIMPIEAYMQNERKAGKMVVAPIPKAMKSVMDVMLIATPACERVAPILSTTGSAFSLAEKYFHLKLHDHRSSSYL